MQKRNVLIFPAGTEIGLEIFNALKDCKEVNLFGAGQDVPNHAKFLFSNYFNLPSIYEKNWIDALGLLCKKNNIDYIFPAYDDVIVSLSKCKDLLPSTILVPSEQICEITRSKSKTYSFLQNTVRVPKVFNNPQEVLSYPVLIKPDRGQGSLGVKKIINHIQLCNDLAELSDAIITEYLPGEEYTIDCFSDREKGLLYFGARLRVRMRNGIAVNTQTIELPEAEAMARQIGKKLSIYGAWFFQIKRSIEGELTLLEVAPRIAGSMATNRMLGVNFPLLAIYEHERIPISICTNKGIVKLDRALGNRYKHSIKFNVLYLDLDDTLIINNKVNELVITLIFQCINEGKKIVLITRHALDLNKTLSQYRISNLFDEIIHLTRNEKKSQFIKEKDAIFLDDSFSERLDVLNFCGIPVFDVNMIELLTKGIYE